jgi:hypothetical protein
VGAAVKIIIAAKKIAAARVAFDPQTTVQYRRQGALQKYPWTLSFYWTALEVVGGWVLTSPDYI